MAKRSPLKVLLFLILLLVVAYLCKRGVDGFYSTPLPSDMPPDMGSPVRVGGYIYVHNTSPGAVSQPASFDMGGESRAWAANTPTPSEAQLRNAPQDDKTLISMFQWDWGVGSRARGWYTYNGRTVYGRYVGGNSHWWSISYVVKPPPPVVVQNTVAQLPSVAASSITASTAICPPCQQPPAENICESPKSCVNITDYMPKNRCLVKDYELNNEYMLVSNCRYSPCRTT